MGNEITANFRWATPNTVEVRFYENGGYEQRTPYIGSCNIHLVGGRVEISMLQGEFGHKRKPYEIVLMWLRERGIKSFHVERNGKTKVIRTG